MMQDSEVIKLVKPVPSDRLATQVLVMVQYGAPQVEETAGSGHHRLFCADDAVLLLPAPAALIRVAVPGRGR